MAAMEINITCKYDPAEITRLVEFAAAHSPSDLSAVHVNVKNCSSAYAGMAYYGVPLMSSAYGTAAEYLVTLRIGSRWLFPKDNMVTTHKWERRPYSEYARNKHKHVYRGCAATKNGKTKTWMEKRIDFRHPYGGKSSPLIVKQDWREGVIAIAAHEFHHIWQFQNKMPRSEVEAEKAALKTLEAYRVKVL